MKIEKLSKKQLEKLRDLFLAFSLIGFIMLMVKVETAWLDFLDDRAVILLIPAFIAFSLVGMMLVLRKLDLVDAYQKGRDDEKFYQLIEEKKKRLGGELEDNEP